MVIDFFPGTFRLHVEKSAKQKSVLMTLSLKPRGREFSIEQKAGEADRILTSMLSPNSLAFPKGPVPMVPFLPLMNDVCAHCLLVSLGDHSVPDVLCWRSWSSNDLCPSIVSVHLALAWRLSRIYTLGSSECWVTHEVSRAWPMLTVGRCSMWRRQAPEARWLPCVTEHVR